MGGQPAARKSRRSAESARNALSGPSPERPKSARKRAHPGVTRPPLRGRDPRTSAELSGTERTYIHPHQGHLGINLRDSGGSIVNGPKIARVATRAARHLGPAPPSGAPCAVDPGGFLPLFSYAPRTWGRASGRVPLYPGGGSVPSRGLSREFLGVAGSHTERALVKKSCNSSIWTVGRT